MGTGAARALVALGELEQPQLAKAGETGSRKNQVIEDLAVDGLGRAGKAPGRTHVAFARGWISAGMVVGKHDARASVDGRIADDRAQREVHARFVSIVMSEMQTLQLLIHMSDPQPLTGRIGLGDTAREERAGGGEAVELERKFGTLISHEAEARAVRLRQRLELRRIRRGIHPFW